MLLEAARERTSGEASSDDEEFIWGRIADFRRRFVDCQADFLRGVLKLQRVIELDAVKICSNEGL